MKTCFKCSQKAEVDLSYGEPYCKKHYLYLIEKRIKKALRNAEFDLKLGANIIKEDCAEYFILMHYLDEIFHGRLNIHSKGVIFDLKTGEEFAEDFISHFTQGKQVENSNISPLRYLIYEDLEAVKKLLGIKQDLKTDKSSVDLLEIKYPGTKFSVLKSLDFFEENQ